MKWHTVVWLLLAQSVWACPAHYYEYNGQCQYEAPMEKIIPVAPDDVKPRRGVQPEWETGDVKEVNEPVRLSNNEVTEKEKADFQAKATQKETTKE